MLRAAAATTEEAPVNPSRTYSNARRRRRRRAPHTPAKHSAEHPAKHPAAQRLGRRAAAAQRPAAGPSPAGTRRSRGGTRRSRRRRRRSRRRPAAAAAAAAAASSAAAGERAAAFERAAAERAASNAAVDFFWVTLRCCPGLPPACSERAGLGQAQQRSREFENSPTLARTLRLKTTKSRIKKNAPSFFSKPTSRSLVEVGLSRNPPSKV